MKKLTIIFFLSLFTLVSATAQQTKWAFDKAHSKIQFDIAHMVVSEVSGQFHSYEGTILADKEDFTDLKINLTIDAKSIDTDHEKRDGHLRSADFFDVENYPTITFVSKSMTKVKDNNYKLTGDFTMHGVTKTIHLFVKYGGTLKSPFGTTVAGFKVTGIDVSKEAVNKFLSQAKKQDLEVKGVTTDIADYEYTQNYDIIMSVATLHLIPKNKVIEVIQKIKEHTKIGGLNLITVFTKKDAGYKEFPELCFFEENEFKELYSDWEILEYDNYVKQEEHGEPHEHNICVIIARK